ncbi:MAG TPA: phage tail protein [Candidatus Dormibacteraeota bacterium]|jgi:phage tail-like protein
MPPPGGNQGATIANKFAVRIDNIETFFSELSGITSEVESVDFYFNSPAGGTAGGNIARLPGKYKPATITLKRGSDTTLVLWAWHQALRDGKMKEASKNGSLLIYGHDGDAPVSTYHFEDAWCNKLTLSGVKAGGSEVLTEECTIVCGHLRRDT